MSADETLDALSTAAADAAAVGGWLGLALAWSRAQPERVGEVALVPGSDVRGFVLGRAPDLQAGEELLELRRPGPTPGRVTGSPDTPRISRRQLLVRAAGGRLEITNVGRCPLRIAGEQTDHGFASPGDTVELRNELLFVCVSRPEYFGAVPERLPRGRADGAGLVGESAAAWKLRQDISFVARGGGHVLVLGPSGSGKELVAAAVHGASSRGSQPWVARNAATLPEGLVDAELFGHVRNYPNPGMPERRGLIGEADGSTLFLDEIGELPASSQAHLLRVLDAGEFQRLGSKRHESSDFRLVAATNRQTSDLKHDFAARFPLRVRVPGLGERREDIPLLARHLLRGMAEQSEEVAARAFPGANPSRPPLLSKRLVVHLLTRPWSTHMRELEQLLWQAVAAAEGAGLDLPRAVETSEQSMPPSPAVPATSEAPAAEPASRPPMARATSRADRLVDVLLRAAENGADGLMLEASPEGRTLLYVCLSEVADAGVGEGTADFAELSSAALARILGASPGLRSKRVRRRDLRGKRWWLLDVTGDA